MTHVRGMVSLLYLGEFFTRGSGSGFIIVILGSGCIDLLDSGFLLYWEGFHIKLACPQSLVVYYFAFSKHGGANNTSTSS